MDDINSLLPDIELKFNIQHPSFEECYMFGYECAQAEISESENPFQINSKEGDQWLDGWWAGFYGEQPIYTLNESTSQTPMILDAANDLEYHDIKEGFFAKFLEYSGALAVSAMIGYQLIDLVA